MANIAERSWLVGQGQMEHNRSVVLLTEKFAPHRKNPVYAPDDHKSYAYLISISYLKPTISLSENLAALSVKIRELQKMCKKGGSQCEFSLAPILTPFCV